MLICSLQTKRQIDTIVNGDEKEFIIASTTNTINIENINKILKKIEVSMKDLDAKIDKINDPKKLEQALNAKFDIEFEKFKNRYYVFFFVLLTGVVTAGLTVYKTFIK